MLLVERESKQEYLKELSERMDEAHEKADRILEEFEEAQEAW